MNKVFEEEKMYLDSTIKRFEEIIKDTELRLDALPRLYRENPTLLASLLIKYKERLNTMYKTQKRPYFARIDFKSDDENNTDVCYIGKVGVFDDKNKLVTVDWRAPIATMYYDSNVGRARYEAPKGEITGDLLVKRQYDIDNGILNSFQDVDTVSNDDMLKPYLGVNADSRLKNIVATIQSEQNAIIREKLGKNQIVQGVAGSGKTTVALHRIAYLVYNNINSVKPEQYLVIGPNRFFINYISSVLPDLDVQSVSQLTYEEIVKELLQENFDLVSDEEKLVKSIITPESLIFEKYRVTMQYKKHLDDFLTDFINKIVPQEDFTIKGYKVLPQSLIQNIYNGIDSNDIIDYDILSKKIQRTILLIGKYIEDHHETISSSINSQYYSKIKDQPKDIVEKERKNKEYIDKELRNFCNQSLKKYFVASRPKILSLYNEFLKHIFEFLPEDKKQMGIGAKKVLANIKSKKVEFEDLAALLYLYHRIYGNQEYLKYRHAVIDESQDFGEFNFFVLKQLMPKCTFSIFGDLSQSIFQYRGVEDWGKVVDSTFEGNCDIKYLQKSYRTTTEIMESANNIVKHIGLKEAQPVIRHGVKVSYYEVSDDLIEKTINILTDYSNKGYSSIAIISKDKESSEIINNKLKEQGINAVNISDFDTEYKGGLCTIPSYLAKGLEFDAVIISNASEKEFNSKSLVDMKLLYVSMTRSLHELNVLYNGNITVPLFDESMVYKKSQVRKLGDS